MMARWVFPNWKEARMLLLGNCVWSLMSGKNTYFCIRVSVRTEEVKVTLVLVGSLLGA
jgi:hypothetical protein